MILTLTLETLMPKLEKAIELARINRLHIENQPMDIDSSDMDSLEGILENVKDDANLKNLEDYLNTFTDKEIMLTQTIMYIGRDENEENLNEESRESLLNSVMKELGFVLDSKIDRKVEISQMTGKVPFDQYLQRGLVILGNMKI
ncbi:hypothetical protein [Geosporobacter ferrireducens]|uniref:Uncharacterized protein n=1 Tax=Geosporobacter ferrireducens TaxID=1424294 RepID=A0A1D8GPB2_9FIRM|nr:hypothetical protein [Geosporobacter ferrireducens]AOT72789.1 hypothetical protein Gferi_26470 [Geosporobacter ferrireducens]